MLLLSVLMFELNHKNWEKIADGKEGEQEKHFAQFVIIFYKDLVRFSVTSEI